MTSCAITAWRSARRISSAVFNTAANASAPRRHSLRRGSPSATIRCLSSFLCSSLIEIRRRPHFTRKIALIGLLKARKYRKYRKYHKRESSRKFEGSSPDTPRTVAFMVDAINLVRAFMPPGRAIVSDAGRNFPPLHQCTPPQPVPGALAAGPPCRTPP